MRVLALLLLCLSTGCASVRGRGDLARAASRLDAAAAGLGAFGASLAAGGIIVAAAPPEEEAVTYGIVGIVAGAALVGMAVGLGVMAGDGWDEAFAGLSGLDGMPSRGAPTVSPDRAGDAGDLRWDPKLGVWITRTSSSAR